jgi:uncharacterized protein (TIGR03067 family)
LWERKRSPLDNLPVRSYRQGMKCRAFTPVLLAISALAFTGSTQADDLKDLEGTWKIESTEANGKKIESDDLKDIEVKFKGDRYNVRVKDTLGAGSLKLDEMQKPKTMDATNTEGDDVGKVVKAIYELAGDTLKVCYTLEGGERPTELATKEGSPELLFIYKREKKAE